MKFVILFDDNPSADPNIRKTHMGAHLAFLDANSERISAAGPLAKPSGENAGGLWIVDAPSAAEVEQLVHEDPFWSTGLRKSFTILTWNQVYANGTRLIDLQ
jgi:uncharacterized protein YciI